ncbi:hypothetical protein [Spiroplasma eriocheiris]|uniref:Uncharacterized protein n=1 Tax=Spiroplasma eriocheiris TaxID=315358 RepID=A0A0H3XN61_9MOLU|nr:hypothetical protein [Spiroplasma eriocheiris]AHF58165.1 hypothetical protein SPE_1050 [Spiroplasma eriocheiris CCTCC M 207170]AKM54602.1 hypothetical protein SERIO_v1c10460 [Spiroplasma eriocheiris]
MLTYDFNKYQVKCFNQNNQFCEIKYLDILKYWYQKGQGIKFTARDHQEYLIKNYWFDYDKPDPDDKFKFECFERDLHRILFLNEWTTDKDAFIQKHYISEEKFQEIKQQKQDVLDEFLKANGPGAKNSLEYRSLLSSFSLLQHKSLPVLTNELNEMAQEYLAEMPLFDKLTQAQSLISFETIALDLYGDPIMYEESIPVDQDTFINVDND